jgi:CpeT protein
MKKIIICLSAIIAFNTSLSAQSKDLKKLAKYMAGSYSSELQHKQDTANYYDIRLSIVPIWKERTDAIWFYVEQAVADYIDKPYRQRVYRLTEKESGTFESAVFTMTNPLRFTHKPELCAKTLTVDSLKERDGCAVILHKKDKVFEGGTIGKGCPSERKGGKYATAIVTVAKKELRSWDRGFNEKDEYVWGAEKAGYIFLKK